MIENEVFNTMMRKRTLFLFSHWTKLFIFIEMNQNGWENVRVHGVQTPSNDFYMKICKI